MARQPRTRKPKTKFKKLCTRCGQEKFLYPVRGGFAWLCACNK